MAQHHFVEIARALSHDARVVIMDEPTAALSRREIDDLFRIVAQLKAAGTAVIFISHKFDEIFAIADRYTVLRDGEQVGAEAAGATIDRAGLIRADGRPRRRPGLPQAEVAASASRCSRSTTSATRPSSTASASRCARARSSASTAWSAPAARRSCRRCSA